MVIATRFLVQHFHVVTLTSHQCNLRRLLRCHLRPIARRGCASSGGTQRFIYRIRTCAHPKLGLVISRHPKLIRATIRRAQPTLHPRTITPPPVHRPFKKIHQLRSGRIIREVDITGQCRNRAARYLRPVVARHTLCTFARHCWRGVIRRGNHPIRHRSHNQMRRRTTIRPVHQRKPQLRRRCDHIDGRTHNGRDCKRREVRRAGIVNLHPFRLRMKRQLHRIWVKRTAAAADKSCAIRHRCAQLQPDIAAVIRCHKTAPRPSQVIKPKMGMLIVMHQYSPVDLGRNITILGVDGRAHERKRISNVV